MGLFQFFRKKKQEEQADAKQTQENTPPIPRELFIKDENDNVVLYVPDEITITDVYKLIQHDYEDKGYQDAYTSQDEKYKNEAIEMLKMDLRIYLQRAANFYNLELSTINFHIESRSRAGLIDMVEHLKNRKQYIEGLLEQIQQLNDDLENERGMPMRMIYSYTRGFTKGLAALSEAKVIKNRVI